MGLLHFGITLVIELIQTLKSSQETMFKGVLIKLQVMFGQLTLPLTNFKSLLAFMLMLPFSSFGQNGFQTIKDNFDRYEAQDLFNGTVLIAEQGDVVFSRSIGYDSSSTRIYELKSS